MNDVVEKPKLTRAEILEKARAARGQKKPEEKKSVVADDLEQELWCRAYAYALLSCAVNHPTKTGIAVAMADQAVIDFNKKFGAK